VKKARKWVSAQKDKSGFRLPEIIPGGIKGEEGLGKRKKGVLDAGGLAYIKLTPNGGRKGEKGQNIKRKTRSFDTPGPS